MMRKLIDNNRGLVLIAVMWVLVILTVIITVVAQASRIDTRISLGAAERIRCKWASRAGLETAIAVLNDDKDSNSTDTFEDLWADNPEDFNDFDLGDCSYSAKVIDECGKLNINKVTKNQLMNLPYMTEEIANSIIDWRDKDDDIRAGGAEEGYYINMPYPYQIRNGPFRTIRELLLVKGVTSELFYGTGVDDGELVKDEYNEGWMNYLTCYNYMRNRDAEGNRLININRYSESRLTRELEIPKSYAKWIVANRGKGFKKASDLISDKSPMTAKKTAAKSEKAELLDVKTVLQIADRIRFERSSVTFGMVNINTAPKMVLRAILEGDETFMENVISYRDGAAGGFTSLGDIANIESINRKSAKKLVDAVTTRSDIFMIQVTSTAYQTEMANTIEAVVDRYESPAKLLFYCSGVKN